MDFVVIHSCHQQQCFSRFFGCGLPFPAKLEGCRVLDLGSGSGRDCYAFSKLVGPSGHVTGVDMTEELVITHASSHDIWHLISVLSIEFNCISLDHSVPSVHWVSPEEVRPWEAQHHFRPGVHGEAQWSWRTEWLNGCCAVRLKPLLKICLWLYGMLHSVNVKQLWVVAKQISFFLSNSSRSNCVLCLCPDKRAALQQAYNVLKVSHDIPTTLMCKKKNGAHLLWFCWLTLTGGGWNVL